VFHVNVFGLNGINIKCFSACLPKILSPYQDLIGFQNLLGFGA